MKNKYLNLLVVIISVIFFLEIIVNNKIVYSTISNSINIWIKVLIPSLFPFFIISDILIDYNIISYIPKKIKYFLGKIFNISESGLTIFLLSMISGFPSNARNTRTMYDNNKICVEEATHILSFTHFSNPLFILTTVGLVFLNNQTLGVIILIAHFASNIIIGLLVRKQNNIKVNYDISNNSNNKVSLGVVLTNSIKHAIDTLLLIFGTLTVFLVISSIIISKFNINIYGEMFLKGILEMTMGIQALSYLKMTDLAKVIFSTLFISFGGLSVHLQVMSQLVGTPIGYKKFFIGRIYQAIISVILVFILYQIIIL